MNTLKKGDYYKSRIEGNVLTLSDLEKVVTNARAAGFPDDASAQLWQEHDGAYPSPNSVSFPAVYFGVVIR